MKNYLVALICFITIVNTAKAEQVVSSVDTLLSGVNNIEIQADFCAVKVTNTESNEVHVTAQIKSSAEPGSYDISVELIEGKAIVSVKKPAQWNSHWGEINLSIPSNTQLEVVSNSGKLELSNTQATQLGFTSKSGHASLSNVQGAVSIKTGNGNISVINCNGSVNGSTKMGSVIIENFKGEAKLSADKGNVTVKASEGDISILGGEGSQEYEKVNGTLYAKSTNGDIKISLCNGVIATRTFSAQQKLFQCDGTYHLQSSKGNIVGTRIKFAESSDINTTEGSIKIQTNTKTNIRYELSSNNSVLRAMGKSKKKSLKIGKGDILISATSTTGAQSYY